MRRIVPVRWLWCSLLLSAVAAADGGNGRVLLLPYVGVRGATVHLSDLLPQEAGPELRAAAGAIEICRAPEIGSLRKLVGPALAERLQIHPAIARQLTFPPDVTIYHAGWPVDGEEVGTAIAGYLAQQGLKAEVPAATLEGLAGTSTRVEHPRFEVRDARLNPARGRMEYELHCAPYKGCNPFLVSAPGTPEVRRALGAKLYGVGTSGRRSDSHPPPAAPATPILIRNGQAATLLMESSGIRIALPVVSLSRGRLGQAVRVRDPANQRVFLGEVIGPAQLRATF